jgi:hypothetical protein
MQPKGEFKFLQKRTESWNITGWSLDKIRAKINGIFKRKRINIEQIHVTPQTLEVIYYEWDESDKDSLNPSKRF